jgi:ABC-2 type transport system permease protein
MNVLLNLLVKELLQLRRDRRMIPMLVVGPIAQILAFGYAANTDVNHTPTLLVDYDRSRQSRELVDRFLSSGYFDLVGQEESVRAIDGWLLTNRAQLALVIGAGYGKAVIAGRAPQVQVIADGSDANSAMVGLGYAGSIVAQERRRLLLQQLQGLVASAAGSGSGTAAAVRAGPGRIQLVPRVWYNPDLRSRWFYVPAVLAMVLMLVTMIMSSMGVVREKEIGTLEQLLVTPVRPWQLIVGKLLPFGLLGIVEMLLVTAVAIGVFGVPLRGSLVLLVALTTLFLLTTLGLGLFVSTVVTTQQQAMMSSIFLFMVPMIYLSGLIFPIENMPHVMQVATRVIPLRYYNHIIRGVFLKGAGLDVLWVDAVVLACFGGTTLALASLRFRKRLD